MPEATETTIITRRVGLRGLSLAALTAGLTAPALATAASATDTDLVAACERLLAVDAAIEELMSWRTTIEQERATDSDLDTLFAQRLAIEAEFDDMDQPTTPAGAAALAQVGLAGWGYQRDGKRIATDFEAWVHLSVLEFMAGKGGRAELGSPHGASGEAGAIRRTIGLANLRDTRTAVSGHSETTSAWDF